MVLHEFFEMDFTGYHLLLPSACFQFVYLAQANYDGDDDCQYAIINVSKRCCSHVGNYWFNVLSL